VLASTLLAVALASCVASSAWGGEPLPEGELPNWIPSVGLGFGIQTRDMRGTISNPQNPFAQFSGLNPIFGGAFLKTDTIVTEPRFACRSAGQFAGFCFFFDDQTQAVDGATLPLGLQLMGPPAPVIPGRIRPFIQGAYAFDFESRVVASSGFKPAGFPVAAPDQFPTLRLELEVSPVSTWWAGGGLAIQAPIDMPLFLKLGFNYSQQDLDLQGNIWRGFNVNNPNQFTERTSVDGDMTIKSWGPSFGLEAEVWRIGSLAMNLSADFYVFLPRSGTDAFMTLQQPRVSGGLNPEPLPCTGNPGDATNCLQPAQFRIDADETQYHGSIMLRLTWLGF
jgi:hypothetical protein